MELPCEDNKESWVPFIAGQSKAIMPDDGIEVGDDEDDVVLADDVEVDDNDTADMDGVEDDVGNVVETKVGCDCDKGREQWTKVPLS